MHMQPVVAPTMRSSRKVAWQTNGMLVLLWASLGLLSATFVTRTAAFPTTNCLRRAPQASRKTLKPAPFTVAKMSGNDEEEIGRVQEESRLKVLKSRRNTIRPTLKAAEAVRNYRISTGAVPELDEDGKPVRSDSKGALTLTAFAVAFGAVILRFGGRAALISGLGIDFATENPELKENLDKVLDYAGSLDPLAEGALFILAWTFVKVFLFDAGGVVLALSSGILFGGVIQGAVFSAFAAAVGSSVAFGLAKLDTPVRAKALELVDEYPSLRGIEKVVARDGLKAILTLRLAPVLPIPIGMYNYVYGVTNVPFLDFFGGIFIGSLKPYLLDSYLGYFGKTLVDGSASDKAGTEDFILLAALGISVLIGVFASQLASETWDSVKEEIDAEQREKMGEDAPTEDDGIFREFFGVPLPQWLVGFQLSLKAADVRMNDLIEIEYNAKVWNYTKDEVIPHELDPALVLDSPEISKAGTGFDFAGITCDGLVLSPALLNAFFKYADPLYDEEKDLQERNAQLAARSLSVEQINIPQTTSRSDPVAQDETATVERMAKEGKSTLETTSSSSFLGDNAGGNGLSKVEGRDYSDEEIFDVLRKLRAKTEKRLKEIEIELKE